MLLTTTLMLTLGVLITPVESLSAQEKLTGQQEQSALKFARQHHPELAELLKKLDEEMTSEYEKAISQIHTVSERLERLKKRSQEDYDLQLSMWKVDSRIKLLAARMTMSSDEKLLTQMEKLLSQKLKFREQQLLLEKKRTTARLKRVEDQLAKMRNSEQDILERELSRYRRLQTPRTSATATKAKPANDKKK